MAGGNPIRGIMRRLRTVVPIAAVLLLILPMGASAQFGRAVQRPHVRLTGTDFEIVRKIVREDFTGKPNGTSLPWNNPDSQNSGTLTLLDTFQSQGRECRRVKYDIRPGPNQPGVHSHTYVLTNCRLADGTWKIDADARPDKPRSR